MNGFRLYRAVLLLAMFGTLAAIAAGFLGWVHPAFDTMSTFRAHLGVVLVLLALLWSFKCSRVPAFIFALAGFLALAAAAPGLPLTSYAALPGGGEKTYRLFTMNLLWSNQSPQKVFDAIRKRDPDIIVVSETSTEWRARLARLDAAYPYKYHCPEYRLFGGSLILSRFPNLGGGEYCGSYGSLGLADFEIDGVKVTIGSVHLRWPWPASGPRQIDDLTPELARLGRNALIAGDFNSVTWSHGVSRFAEAGGLQVVKGIGPSWSPSVTIGQTRLHWPSSLGLPIDNVMTKGAVQVFSAKTLEAAGSDHLPILVEFTIRQ